MPCDGDTDYAKGSSPGDAALDWSGRTRSARPARMDKPLRCRPLEGRRDHRSPLRRCFQPRPPWRTGCAGFASGCRSSSEEETFLRRLAGLLSRYLPTDTWPQARANLGNRHIGRFAVINKRFLARGLDFAEKIARKRRGKESRVLSRAS